MNGKLMMYVDQYADLVIWTRSARDLRRQCEHKGYPGRLFKIYVDKVAGEYAGKSVHCGYGVGKRWFNAFIPYEKPA